MDDIERAIAGDDSAIARLLHKEFESVKRFVERRIPPDLVSKLSAEDVIQDAFVHVFRDIGTFSPTNENSFAAWLQRIVANRLVDSIRELRRVKRGGKFFRRENNEALRESVQQLIELVEQGGPSPSQNLARNEAIEAMQFAIGLLPEDQRDAILLRYIDGKSLAETAALMDKTEAAVRGLLQRAKVAIRQTLGESVRWFSKKA